MTRAIERGERARRYAELRQATAGLLYLRNKADGEVRRLRAEMARARADAREAVLRRDDATALSRIGRVHTLETNLERAEREHAARAAEAEAAKRSLEAAGDGLRAGARGAVLDRLRADVARLAAEVEVEAEAPQDE